ncbi:Carboxypeptidase regulatory-like domain-containing protein [Candidatus Electrothrix gigas]
MQKLQSEQRVRLVVRAYDRCSEVFLVNSDFQRIAAGIGELEAVVSPGIYKARFRIGQKQVDQLVEVARESPERATLEICGDPVDFSSPVPLAGIGAGQDIQEVHRKAAEKFSQLAVSEQKGAGSWLFLFIREITDSAAVPWAGITLHDLDGALIAEPNQGICDQENGYFALHLEVDPGTYRLRVEEEPGEFYEMFVQTEAGWQTQVFAVSEQAWLPDIQAHRAALSSAAVLMAEAGQGFTAKDEVARQVELLRLGLLHRRKVVTETFVADLLQQESLHSLNPLQVILLAHSLAEQGKLDTALLTTLLKKLPANFAEHADIQALMLNQPATVRPAFFAPPMLHSSWDRIVQAVKQRKAIIPPGSLAAQLDDSVIKTALWLVHRPDSLEI